MRFIANVSNGFFWLVIVSGLVFLFTIPSPNQNGKIKKLQKQLYQELKYPFELPKLKFEYNVLEPYIDEQTLKIHHTRHHQGYVDNLNKAMEEYPEYQAFTLEELLANLNFLPVPLRQAVKSHGGGHFNHSLFWDVLCGKKAENGLPAGIINVPTDILLDRINISFQSLEKFKQEFLKKALSIIGSGWVWLCADKKGDLIIIATYNHETPQMTKYQPILILDVWEHAYYLKYQNKRADFVNTWWNVVDWKMAEKLYFKAIQN